MSEVFRRVVLKPAGLSGDQLTELAGLLRTAVEAQNQFAARSAHVLRLVGGLQETEHTFFVEHEPARPVGVKELFHPGSPPADEKTLLRMTAALFDALRATHEMPGSRPSVHGGLCPGTLLISDDGIEKVSDFGFAPALCAALGPEAYVNLAVGPRTQGQAEHLGTGVWEVLAPQVADRDDRICSFIDPEKYGTRLYHSFEPKSDIVAAGFILHLLAEHRHPYFHDDPEAHRMVEVAEYMAMSTGTRARRKELRESEEPAVRLWCELVDKMIDRLPQNRPSASELASQLGQYQRPVGPEEILQRRFEALLSRLETKSLAEVEWDSVVAEAKAVANAPTTPPEVREPAQALIRLGQAAKALSGSGWREAAGPLAELSTTARLPTSLAGKAAEAKRLLEQNQAAQKTLDRIEAELRDHGPAEPAELADFIASLQERLGSLRASPGLVPEISERIEARIDELATRHREAVQEAERLEAVARDWLATLQASVQAGAWDAVEQRLADRPLLPAGLQDVAAQAAEVEGRLRHRRELLEHLRESEARLASGEVAEARRLAQVVEGQDAHPDLAERARALNSRIDDEERRLQEEQRRIEEARKRAEEILARAKEDVQRDTWASLEEAKSRAAEALDIPEISSDQQARAQRLLDAAAKRMKGLLAEAQLGVEVLRQAEVDLQEARQLLEAGHVLQAEAKVTSHVHSDFPNIQEEAERLAAEIATRKRAEEARLKAVAEKDQAIAALREGDLQSARASAEAALGNAHIEAEVRADIERMLGELPALEAAQALMDREDLPHAIEALESRAKGGPIAPSIRAGADRLLARARQLQKQKLLDSICGHLLHRAQREGESSQVDGVPPDESLPPSAPDWVRTTLTDFETFLQDCTVAGRSVPVEESLAAGARLGEKYEVLEFLGRGGMGEVYRARDLSLDREVALKLARPAAESGYLVEALRNEAKAIAALKHPHIIHINNFEVIGNRPCFDTNYIRGRDLDQYARGHSLSWRQMAEILIPIAEALAYAHRQGVLHRDVKPQNIYLGERPGEGPWLIDFGLARMRSMCDRRANTGLCGTPGYIAPEVITSMGMDVDHRADIFSLGCVLYGLLAKEVPFRRSESAPTSSGPSVSRTLLNTLRTQLIPLSEAAPKSPEVLRRICERAMAHEPQDRYQDAEQVARDLRRFLVLLDRRDAEAAIAQARASFAERPQGEPAELEALDRISAQAEAARNLAERSRRRAEQIPGWVDETLNRALEEVKRQAAELTEEVQQLKQKIVDSQAQAKRQLEAAGTAMTARRFRVALNAAREVLGTPYAPDLHDQAGEIAQRAEQYLRQAWLRRIKIGAVVSGTVVGVLAACWYFFLMPFAPRILRSPGDIVASVSETVTLRVDATARPEPTYQWQKRTDGVWNDLPGKTQAALTIGPVQPEDAGEYQCLVRNARGAKWVGTTLSIKALEYALSASKQGVGTVEISPAGGPYAKETEVTLKATPADGWRFVRWEGLPAGSQPTARVIMDQDRSVRAVFAQVVYALTAQTQGEGRVDVSPADGPYAQGTEITLKATPAEGWRFERWEGLPADSPSTASLTMDQDRAVTAVFVPVRYALTAQTQGEGTVQVAPAAGPYARGTEVTLKATPADGWQFVRWDGVPAGSQPTARVTMDQDRAVTAVFAEVVYTLTARTQGEGKVDVSPAVGPYTKGTEVTLKATPADGWQFVRWDGVAAGSQPTVKVIMDQDRSVTAVFAQVVYTLTARTQGEGRVEVTPAAGPYAEGTQVTLKAVPMEGWRFERWEGLPANSQSTASLTMDQDRAVTAVFVPVRYALTAQTQGEGTVQVAPAAGPYARGTEVTLQATPADGWQFVRWDGVAAGSQPTAKVIMDQDRSVTAVFAQVVYTLTARTQGEGRVEVTPAAGPYAEGTQVTLKAVPMEGWQFVRWDGVPAGSQPTAKVIMDQNRAVTAIFAQVVYTLTARTQGEGRVDVSPAAGPYAEGTQVTLKAVPMEGWRFERWEGLPADSPSTASLTMDQDRAVTAVFVQIRYALTTGKQGEGKVEVAPAGGPYAKGAEVTLKATPAEGWRFERWEGLSPDSQSTVRLIMDQDKAVTAVFVPAGYVLSVERQGEGSLQVVRASGQPGTESIYVDAETGTLVAGSYPKGTEVKVTATPAENWRFEQWVGFPADSGQTITLIMDRDRMVTAVFAKVTTPDTVPRPAGWAGLDEAMEKKIAALLVSPQNAESPVRGLEPNWIRFDRQGTRLNINLTYPWAAHGWAVAQQLTVNDVPFPGDSWPQSAEEQPASAAAAIAAALQEKAGADLLVNSVLQYLGFWAERAALEKELIAKLPAGANGPVSLDPGELGGNSGLLTRLARVKWMSRETPDTPPIGEWTRRVQEVLRGNHGKGQVVIQVLPTRFIEYFWGPEFVHAIYWFGDAPGPPAVRYVRLGTSAEIGRQAAGFVRDKTLPAGLGERLLGPIVRDTDGQRGGLGFFAVTDPGKTFGIALAPDGPLCFLPLEKLEFDPLAVDMAVPDAAIIANVPKRLNGQITKLEALYAGPFESAHTAAWVLASLAGPPPAGPAPTPTELWRTPCAMVTDQSLAPSHSINDYRRAFNADVVCFRSDQVAVRAALQKGIQRVDSLFNMGAGGESFDAGFLYPRVNDLQASRFVLVASPVRLSP